MGFDQGLHVEAGALSSAGDKIVSKAVDFRNDLSTLQAHIDGLLNIWKGEAKDAFNSAYENDIKADLYRFQETLTQMGENVTAAAGILSGSDSDAEAGARHLGVRF